MMQMVPSRNVNFSNQLFYQLCLIGKYVQCLSPLVQLEIERRQHSQGDYETNFPTESSRKKPPIGAILRLELKVAKYLVPR